MKRSAKAQSFMKIPTHRHQVRLRQKIEVYAEERANFCGK